MIARLRVALLRWLVGPPCRACSLPCPPDALEDHLQWHRTEALMAGRPAASSVNPRPVRPARPRPGPRYLDRALDPKPRLENGGPE